MKILHTGDWHLGHTLFGYDRTEEQQSMLQQMVGIAKEQQPDVFVIAGDVYHTPQPSAAIQTLFNKTIIQLHDQCPKMPIVVTAGNHDSSSKHEIFRTPWEYLNVFMIGSFDRDNPHRHILQIPGVGFVIALPFTHERNLQGGVLQQLLDETEKRNTDHLPVLLTAHTTIAGANFKGHDDADGKTIGGIDAIDVHSIGTGYDYLALGHIHHPQFVHTGKHNVRYAGSPLPVSFDEEYEHSVSIVEIGSHGEQPKVQTVSIANPHPLTTLPAVGAASWKDAKTLLKDFPDDLPNYIRLNVEVTDALPSDAKQEAVQLTDGKQCRFCLINVVKHRSTRTATAQVTVEQLRLMTPLEVAQMYAKDTNMLFDEQMQQMMLEVMEQVKANI
ncbi:MAG: exonuclease SbcCD subunit D [Paludibacteraceae bacterium]|nr:exonuclease SbcCD subunit D [Paludibacteraceae bacterium]